MRVDLAMHARPSDGAHCNMDSLSPPLLEAAPSPDDWACCFNTPPLDHTDSI